VRALEDPWRRVESRENLIYLVFCDILCGCPRGGCGWRWPRTTRCLRTAI